MPRDHVFWQLPRRLFNTNGSSAHTATVQRNESGNDDGKTHGAGLCGMPPAVERKNAPELDASVSRLVSDESLAFPTHHRLF